MAVNEGNIVIDRLESSIEDMMSRTLSMSPKCCIFKTPSILKRHNKNAFIPDAFSFGPLYHGSQNFLSFEPGGLNLKAIEKIKAGYLKGLLDRSPNIKLRSLINSIMEVENDARECYAEDIDYSREDLVKILVIDGCFIIELFRKKEKKELREKGDPIFTMSCMLQFLYHDLILLENQVPWMVLVRLFHETNDSKRLVGETKDDKALITLAVKFFESNFLSYGIDPQDDQCTKIEGIKHFVDLFRKLSILDPPPDHQPDHRVNIRCIDCFVDPLIRGFYSTLSAGTEKKKERLRGWHLLPSATVLSEAGIQFKKGTNSERILDITFKDGVLEIPPLVIHDLTETVFRNLISYEQCQPKFGAKITSYAILLDNLINTAEDMDVLCKKEIIDNWLNPENAAQLFNKLYHDTYVKTFHYNVLCKDVNQFCERRLPRWRTMLVRNYFNTPWAILSTSAAVILLILTLVQTWYTIKG